MSRFKKLGSKKRYRFLEIEILGCSLQKLMIGKNLFIKFYSRKRGRR
jgi:hypothetical protein